MKSRNAFLFSLLILLVLSVMNVYADNEPAPGPPPLFDFGVKAALVLPSYIWVEDLSWNQVTETAIMPAAYLFGAINITDSISVQIEAGYEGKGANIDATDGNLLWLFNYVEIPVMIKYTVRASTLEAWVAGGGYYAMFLGGVYDFDVPGSEWEEKSGSLTTGAQEIVTEIRPHDFGLVLSAGGKFGNLLYELRMPFGLSPVLAFTPADSDFGGYRKAVNSGVMFFVGYQF